MNPNKEREARLAAAANAKRALMRKSLAKLVHDSQLIRPIPEWPSWTRELLFKEHKNRNERYNLIVWLWRNGVESAIAAEWTMYHGRFNQFEYDKQAHLQVEGLVKGLRNKNSKEYKFAMDKPIFVMEENKVEPQKTRSQF